MIRFADVDRAFAPGGAVEAMVRYIGFTGHKDPEIHLKRIVREAIPLSAILLPLGFFFSVLDPGATDPNALIYLAYAGAVALAAGLLILGVGLIRGRGE
ncbi:hypothetical protein [Methanoculleus bourgensis]|uniref:hypothetical protein n=1 Tax=Methanoculleus bourgensis TaxID=83986 RepID=UPI0022EEDDBB|nr:hypothetical protein [Methanoculleus bourgensis]GLI46903.1 hypothetical protein MBOURGENBZM_16950 [Methanoculleus bourgensis]